MTVIGLSCAFLVATQSGLADGLKLSLKSLYSGVELAAWSIAYYSLCAHISYTRFHNTRIFFSVTVMFRHVDQEKVILRGKGSTLPTHPVTFFPTHQHERLNS